MPIQYYCGITMNQNSIVTPVIDPLGTAPSVGTEVEGQQYYNTATNLMYFWNGTAWVEMDGTGSGVLSISIAAAGTNAGGINTSLVIDSSTSANTLQPMQFGGSANIGMVPDASGGTDSVKFLKGDGTWATPGGGGTMSTWLIEADGANSQTVSDGETLDIVGSTYITAVASAVAAGNYMVTISHDLTSRTDTASAASPAYGAAFTAIDSVTTNSTGHVTALNLKTVTLPAASSRWTAVGETGSQVVSYGDTVNFLNDTNGGIDTKVDTSTADVSVLLQMDVQDLATDAAPATGDFIPLSPAAGGGTEKATIASILALAPQGDITEVQSATAAAQRGIKVTNPGGPIPVVGLDIINQVNLATTPTGLDELIIYDESTTTNKSITVANLVAAAPQGVVTSIGNGTFTTVGGTAAVPVINVTTVTAKTASTIMARDASGFGFVQTPASGDSSDKIATTSFVQSAVTGLLEFKGGFNANSGVIDGGATNLTTGAARIAVEVGDYYVVTTLGDFFGNTATPLSVGDSVIVQTAAAVGTSVEADFIIVQSDTDLATLATVGIGNVNAGTGIGVVYSSGTATVTNSSPNIVQDLWATFTSDSGSTTANSATDSLSVVGGTGITTSIAGDVLTITGASTYVLPKMTSTVRGGGELFSDTVQTVAATAVSATASRTYGVQMNSSEQLVVNVPWVDTNTQTVTSVTASAVNNRLGLEITPTTGAVVAGLNIVGQTNLASADAVDADELLIYDSTNTTNKAITLAELRSYDNYAATITGFGTVTHGLGSFDVVVQLYNDSTKETIEACVDRTAVDTVGISGGSFPAGNIRVLVTKIG
jgi:hypothetical protein